MATFDLCAKMEAQKELSKSTPGNVESGEVRGDPLEPILESYSKIMERKIAAL